MIGVIPIEEITKEISKMGYITVEPKGDLKPSYYKLKDGTILRVITTVTHLTPNPQSPQGFALNSFNTIICYVPKEYRHPEFYKPFNNSDIKSNIMEEDMDIETLKEEFSVYSLSNGRTMSVKSIVAQVSKTKLYTPDGEPLYVVNITPVIKTKKTQ